MKTVTAEKPTTDEREIVVAGDGSNSDTRERLVIKKDLGQFDARIAHYPDEVREAVTYLYSINQTEFSGKYSLLAHLIRTEARLNVSDQYVYQLLSGKYFRPDKDGKAQGSTEKVLEIAGWLRTWALFNSEAGGMPFIETPTWRELVDYMDAKRAPETVCKFGAIVGSTGTGKSRMLKRYELLRNHGNTRRIEAPSNATLPKFLKKLGFAFGVPLSSDSAERMERIAESVTARRSIIIDNTQKLYHARRGANQPILDYLQELQDDTGCTIFLSWTPIFTKVLSDGVDKAYFEQFVGRVGGLDTIHELPEFAPLRDLRAIQEKMKIGGGQRAIELMRKWSREPGRLRILYSRIQLARRAANDDGCDSIKLAHLEAADLSSMPPAALEEGGES